MRKNQNGIVIQMIVTAMLNRAYIISKENIDVTLTDLRVRSEYPSPYEIKKKEQTNGRQDDEGQDNYRL